MGVAPRCEEHGCLPLICRDFVISLGAYCLSPRSCLPCRGASGRTRRSHGQHVTNAQPRSDNLLRHYRRSGTRTKPTHTRTHTHTYTKGCNLYGQQPRFHSDCDGCLSVLLNGLSPLPRSMQASHTPCSEIISPTASVIQSSWPCCTLSIIYLLVEVEDGGWQATK
jgi:hypothetical protein